MSQKWSTCALNYCHQLCFLTIKEKPFRGDIYCWICYSPDLVLPRVYFCAFPDGWLFLPEFYDKSILDHLLSQRVAGLYLAIIEKGGICLLKRVCCSKLDSSFLNFRYPFLIFKFQCKNHVLINVLIIHSFFRKYSQRYWYKPSKRLPIKTKLYFDLFIRINILRNKNIYRTVNLQCK